MSKISNTAENQTDKGDTKAQFNLRATLSVYTRHWKYFLFSIVLFVGIGAVVYLSISKQFDSTTSVIIKEEGGKSPNSALGNLEALGLLSTTNNIDNEIAMFAAPNLVRQVADSLDLFIRYHRRGLLRNTEIYNQSPYNISIEGVAPEDLKGSAELIIVPISSSNGKVNISGTYKIQKSKFELENGDFQLPCSINLPNNEGRIVVSKRNTPLPRNTEYELSPEDSYLIEIENIRETTETIGERLAVQATSRFSSVLEISVRMGNKQKGEDFLAMLVKCYNKNNVSENAEISLNTTRFVNERLLDISRELKDIEGRVVSYKRQEGITDIAAETKVFLQQNADIEQKRIEAETQLKLLELIDNYINKAENQNKLIPNIGIEDKGLAGIIAEYNNQLLAYERIERSTSEDSPTRERARTTLKHTRQSIQSAILNLKRAATMNKQELTNRFNNLTEQKRSIPQQEYALTEILRQQQVIQAIYIFLMQTREQSSVTLAATSDKARVISDPISERFAVSPNRNIILLAFTLLGFLIPMMVIYLKELLRENISGREELERLAHPAIVGEVIKIDDKSQLLIRKNDDSPLSELIRALRNNIQFVVNGIDKKVVLITSTVPNEGKSFITENLAISFAQSGKRILLLGMDIRNPQLAKDMQFPSGKGVTTYLSTGEDWKNLITRLPEYPNLDILQAGAIPPNPNELLLSSRVRELFDEARTMYDYILVDSAPVGVISDTLLVAPNADATIFVTRENTTPRKAITYINKLWSGQRLPGINLVLNGIDATANNSLGYGYGYGYGNNKHKKINI